MSFSLSKLNQFIHFARKEKVYPKWEDKQSMERREKLNQINLEKIELIKQKIDVNKIGWIAMPLPKGVGEYEGQFQYGYPNGWGKALYSNGYRYEGQWSFGQHSGLGISSGDSKSLEEAIWTNGLPYGIGIYQCPKAYTLDHYIFTVTYGEIGEVRRLTSADRYAYHDAIQLLAKKKREVWATYVQAKKLYLKEGAYTGHLFHAVDKMVGAQRKAKNNFAFPTRELPTEICMHITSFLIPKKFSACLDDAFSQVNSSVLNET